MTDLFTLGASLTTVPTTNFVNNNAFMLLPKYTVINGERNKLALGALIASVPEFDDGDRRSVGVLYGVATTGTTESNLTAGLGWGYVGDDLSNRPVATLGALHRFSRRAAFITENWFFPFEDNGAALLTYGIRFLGDKMSVDLAFANVAAEGAPFLIPGIPLIGFAVKF